MGAASSKKCCCAEDVAGSQKDVLDGRKVVEEEQKEVLVQAVNAVSVPEAPAKAPVVEEQPRPLPPKVEEVKEKEEEKVVISEEVVNGEFTVLLKKTADNMRLGMAVDIADPKRMIVEKIIEGLVQQWNEKNPKLKIGEGDEVLSVNGVSGDAMKMS